MPFRSSLTMISETSSGATAATRDTRRAPGVHIQRSLDESAVRRSHHQHTSGRVEEERLSHGQQQEVSLSDTAIGIKTSSEGRLEDAGSDAGGAAAETVGTTGARGKVRMGELNKAKSSSTSQLSQTGKQCLLTCARLTPITLFC